MEILAELRMFARKRRLTLEDARAIVRRRIEERESNLLELPPAGGRDGPARR